jgi:arginase
LKDVTIGVAKFIHDGNFARVEFDAGPDIMEGNGLYDLLDELGVSVSETVTARLTDDEEKEYGTIYRLGLASGHMSEIVSSQIRRDGFSLALISNCIGLMGVLGGVQRSGDGQPLRVGLVYFDAHADINTPETTRSGLMGGMPVASATGMCFHRLRRMAGLEVALPTRYVTYVGVREVDALEYEILDRSDVEYITVDDVKSMSPAIKTQMDRLSGITDLIYIHIDTDVLNPGEMPGHTTPEPGGFSSEQLSECLEFMCAYPNVVCLGVASMPTVDDPSGASIRAFHKMIEGAMKGIKKRKPVE